MLNLIAVLIFGCAGLAVIGLMRLSRPAPAAAPGAPGAPAESAPGAAPDRPARQSFLDRWERMAAQAGLHWTRTIYYAFAGGCLAVALLLGLMGHGISAFLVAGAGFLGPELFVRQARARRAALFVRQLPGALFLASSVLRAGGTLMQAVDSIATEMPAPVGTEFRHIQQQMRLQVSAQEAFAEASARVGVREFAAVVVATRITAEVGGNLAHIFDQISKSILEAENAQRTIQAFTTEGRMSANLIAALPFVVMGLMQLISPDYFKPLFSTIGGVAVLALCVGMIITGWVVIRRMINIRMF